MKRFSSSYKRLVFLIVLIVVAGLVFFTPDYLFAQPGLPDSPEQTPIDGGLGILAALGGTYAIKKLRDRNQE